MTPGADAPTRTPPPSRRTVLPCALSRPSGSAIAARVIELSLGGVRVVTPRPLALDETLLIDISCDERHVTARARVVCQERPDVYALRFSVLSQPMLERLSDIVCRRDLTD